jgi:D-glycero-D-manno-heptose 1,7-bisphosphate phosphatase
MAMTPAPPLACLDKDGTLVDDVPYNVDPAAMRLAYGAEEALRTLTAAGFRVVVVSNQPGVTLGRFDESALRLVHRRLDELCASAGSRLAGFYYCPHAPADSGVGCECRKPEPGLVERALRDHGADPRRSWMVGDILDDIEAGRRAGCRTVLVDNGNETEWRRGPVRRPHHVVRDLAQAARLIVSIDAAAQRAADRAGEVLQR